MQSAGRVVRKLFVLLLGEGAARLLGVATFAALARALGLEHLGIFSFGMSLALVLECVMDFGQNAHIGRIVAENPEEGLPQFALAASNKTLIGAALAAIVAVVMVLAGSSAEEIVTVALLLVWAAGLSVLDSLRSTARSLERFRLDSATNGAESLGRFAAVALVWWVGGGLVHFGLAFALESWIAVAVLGTYLGRRHAALVAPPRSLVSLRGFLWQAAPFGIAVMALSAFYNLDQVFVRSLAGAAANGLYGTAARVSFTASVVASLLAMVTYPDFARMSADLRAFKSYLVKAILLAGAIGVTAGAVIFVSAGPLLKLLFGAEFAGAADILRVLVIVVVFRGITTVVLYAANALGLSRRIALIAVVFAAANVTANVVLVPVYGVFAAAWISAVGELALSAALTMLSLGHIRSAASLRTTVE